MAARLTLLCCRPFLHHTLFVPQPQSTSPSSTHHTLPLRGLHLPHLPLTTPYLHLPSHLPPSTPSTSPIFHPPHLTSILLPIFHSPHLTSILLPIFHSPHLTSIYLPIFHSPHLTSIYLPIFHSPHLTSTSIYPIFHLSHLTSTSIYLYLPIFYPPHHLGYLPIIHPPHLSSTSIYLPHLPPTTLYLHLPSHLPPTTPSTSPSSTHHTFPPHQSTSPIFHPPHFTAINLYLTVAYGIVWKAIDRRTGEVVAVKKIFDAFRNETDAQRTFREIVFLLEFSSHPNVIRLLNVLRADNNKDIYLVFQFMETDLHNVIKKGNVLEDIHRRYIMYQLFRAARYLHSGSVIHRDLKPSNLLVDSDCRVKVADFGLARSVEPSARVEPQGDPTLTNYVATRWYRAPEILLNSKRYTLGVDMWSLGCILGEMLLGKPMFPGSSTIDQIERIMAIISPPSRDDLHQVSSQYAATLLSKPLGNGSSGRGSKSLREILTGAPNDAIDLIEKLLLFSPDRRLTAEQALKHPYVARFHNSANEPCLEHAVVPCLRDDVQLSVDVYRNKLYELIASRKSRLKTSSSTSNISAKATMQQSNHSSSSHSKRNNQNVLSNSQNISPARVGGGGLTQTNSQPIKVKVVARKLERHPVPRAEEFCVRQSSKDSDKSSAKSSAKSSSSSSPASNGRRKSLSPVTTQQQEKRNSHVPAAVQRHRHSDQHTVVPSGGPVARSGGVTVTIGDGGSTGVGSSGEKLRGGGGFSRSVSLTIPANTTTSHHHNHHHHHHHASPTKVVTSCNTQMNMQKVSPTKKSPPATSPVNTRTTTFIGRESAYRSPSKYSSSTYNNNNTRTTHPLFATYSQHATISSTAYRELRQGVK
ncbi:hypothetical protein Pcinc_019639 [Petrolisthes cinctipes]|uniref:mitogen-activated protein kinase n=1 Tax=Petrolisthes cinctipes TaxID=88211 RepID=A0AAE1FJQ3_PETCI|nr:hypothetical protein Pcinc_019639 [Petrolisthes cinctipes]